MSEDLGTARQAFIAGAQGFSEVVGQIGADVWDRPALGVWSVRDLAGHTSRALSTVQAYLGKEPTAARLASPVAYFLATRSALADPGAVAQRGRDAGAALGEDPAGAVAALARKVAALVEGSAEGATVICPVGTMALDDYLPTRTFELAVHSLDLVRATGIEAPAVLGVAVRASCELAGRLAGQLPNAPDLLLSLTGRTGLPDGLSIV
jgi:uncharacterized protein (TIGR03083 family)